MAYIYDLTDTWNASGTTFNGIKLNVTDSASASSSKLVTLQTNSTEHFSITKAGVGYISGNLGVGTASPATKLHLLTASATAVAVRAANSVSYAELQVDSSGNSQLVAPGGVQIFNTNGSERMRISSAGNVGIGTNSPGAKFQVIGSTTVAGYANVAAAFGAGVSSELYLGSLNGNNPYIGSGGAFPLSFNTNGSERARIDSSGNFGIGTSSPGSKLEVVAQDAIRITGFQPFQTLRDSNDSNKGFRIQTAGGATLFSNDSTGGGTYTERMRITGGGNVGIGTNSPASLFHAKLGSAATEVYPSGTWAGRIINATDSADYNGLLVGNRWASTNSWVVDFGSIFGNGSGSWSSYYKIDGVGQSIWGSGSAGTERMRLNSSGFLLVGATSPMGGNTSSEFKVTGAGSWPLTLNANDRGLLIRNSASSAGVYAYFEYNGGTNNGQISFSGGTTSYTTTSDARVKKNIVDAPDAGALIDAIKVRSWDFKVDDMHWRYGMVAQELISIAPEAVTVPEDEDKMMGIDYSKLVPMLIKEVQSLRARVAQLEGN